MTLSLAPPDIATCMYHTGLDPFTGEEVFTAKGMRDRKMQRALMQFFKAENYFMVKEALTPPKSAIEARRWEANEVAEGDH